MRAYLYEVDTDKGRLRQTVLAPDIGVAEQLLTDRWGPDSKPVFVKELHIYGTECPRCRA